MTGFGEGACATAAGRLRVELRIVNHRYLHVNARLPAFAAPWEGELREWLRAWFARGSVNCTVRLESNGSGSEAQPPIRLRLDEDRVQNYLALFSELGAKYQLPGEPDLALLARYNDIFVREEADAEDLAVHETELRTAVEEAARQAVQMREEEGRRLAADLEQRLHAVALALNAVAELAPRRLNAERDRLQGAVAELLGGAAPDPDRIAQEIVLLAERWDVNEELVRFRSHIELFRDLLAASAHEPVGKRLSFLVQEMHREANTIGSKANHAGIAHQVVGIKEEIERLREQVENVE